MAKKLNWTFLDADDYYWEKTNPPFQKKIELEHRNRMLKKDFAANKNVIINGSLYTWSEFWNTAFDLGVFLSIPKEIRMKRLLYREIERYGEQLKTSKKIQEKSKVFLEWAAKYDDNNFEGRSMKQHQNWIKIMNCEVIALNGDLTNKERQRVVIKKIKTYV